MAFFWVTAIDQTRANRPVALLEAPSADVAVRRVRRMKADGELFFIPDRCLLAARRASERELEAFREHMRYRTSGADIRLGGARYRERAVCYFHKLFREAAATRPSAAAETHEPEPSAGYPPLDLGSGPDDQ